MPELEIAKRSRESLLRLTTALLEAELAALRQMMPGTVLPATNKEEKEMAERTVFINQSGPMTHALLIEGGQVINRAEAKCGPDDTFDLAIGAKLALDRLFDEGKKEAPEPIKLYCVKDDPDWLTKGKIYEYAPDEPFAVTYDNGAKGGTYDSLKEFHKRYPQSGAPLWPLVSRPAKVGEWVLITNAQATSDTYKDGEVCLVTEASDGSGPCATGTFIKTKSGKTHSCCIRREGEAFVYNSEYLVLDGYQPEPEKPKYYSGKAVCVKPFPSFTPGKVYEFKYGVVIDDNGNKRPNGGSDPIENLDSHWAKDIFIEFKG